MYSTETLRKGIEYLGITDRVIIKNIMLSNRWNLLHPEPTNEEKIARNKAIMNFDRTKVPKGLNKKELNALLKDTQKEIDTWKAKWRNPENNEITKEFCLLVQEEWMEKKKNINAVLKNHKEFGSSENLEKAKSYPIEQLIDFNKGGFAKCLWHNEKSGSLKWYPKRNKAHCFAGCGDFDSIDAYQKINNVDLTAAIKALAQ